jgi:hypothetical protein
LQHDYAKAVAGQGGEDCANEQYPVAVALRQVGFHCGNDNMPPGAPQAGEKVRITQVTQTMRNDGVKRRWEIRLTMREATRNILLGVKKR